MITLFKFIKKFIYRAQVIYNIFSKIVETVLREIFLRELIILLIFRK